MSDGAMWSQVHVRWSAKCVAEIAHSCAVNGVGRPKSKDLHE